MVNGNLPDGWSWTTVGDVVTKMSNGIVEKQTKDGNGLPVTRIETISQGVIDLERVGYLQNLSTEIVEKYRLHKGDILFSHINSDTHLGKTAIFEKDHSVLLHGMNLLRLQVNANIVLPRFFHYCCNHYRFSGKFIEIAQHAVNQSSINQKKLSQVSFPLPSLHEQERIVAKIEELFTQLEAGTAALERVQAGLKRYKASVLKSAFEGRLVSQNKSDESATTLLEKTFGKDYEKLIAPSESSKVPYVPTGWAYGKLENLIYIAGRIGWRGLKADEYTQEGPLFLSVYNLNKGDHVDFSDAYHISKERYDESPEIMLQENDILLTKDGAGIGKIGIVKDLPGQATVNSSLLVIRASDIFIPEFLFYLLKGPQMQDIVRERITGSATPHLFQRDIKKFTLLIPPLEEQRRIVAEVERRLSLAAGVESTLAASLSRAGRLRQSILKSAFEGKL